MSIRPNNKYLRVAIITRSLMTGGAQRQIIHLCSKAAENQVELVVFLLVKNEKDDFISELPITVEVVHSPISHKNPKVVFWLARELKKKNIEVAHSFLWTADAIASLSKFLFSSIPLICSERGDRSASVHYSRIKNTFDRLITFNISDSFCANSEFGKRSLIENGCDKSKIQVIYNGVNLENSYDSIQVNLRQELGWPEDCHLVGIVSRLVWYKGIHVLIKAVADLRSVNGKPVYCVVIGDGPERNNLENLTRNLGISEQISFLGSRSPSEPYIYNFDIATLCTITETESCSNSILEYMACGRPVIATSVAGNPELLEDTITGILISPNDSEELSLAIERLVVNPEERQKMGQRGRMRVEKFFNIDKTSKQFVQLWHTFVNK